MTGTSQSPDRFCDTCKRKEHKHSKDGICHYCWGSGRRKGEMMPLGGELCRYCVAIFPEPSQFCIHGTWFFHGCKSCKEQMRKIGTLSIKQDDRFYKFFEEFASTHILQRLDQEAIKKEMSPKLRRFLGVIAS